MDLDYSPEDHAFRDEARAFVDGCFPDGRAYEEAADRKRWAKALFDRGWGAYRWPVAFGGTGWSATRR